MKHVVWDWNGTLFNDLHLLVEATNESSLAVGGPPLGLDDYRRHHVRPLSVFYERLAGRTLSDEEWDTINHRFHDTYASMLHRAELAIDATAAMDRVADDGGTQSLLSMWVHDQLVPFVKDLGVEHYFVRIDGLPEAGGAPKASYLEQHLRHLEESLGHRNAANTVMIGDTVDDGVAARAAGIDCVLVTTGAQRRDDLIATGWPVTDSLTHAVEVATS